MSSHNFETFSDLAAWCAVNGGEEALHQEIAHGRLHTRAMVELGERWLRVQANNRAEGHVREAICAARDSARSALIGLVIAVSALLFSAWPYILK